MAISVNTFEGSSPHTRGAHVGDQAPQLRLGIIPAYAGSTPPSGTEVARETDHPRIRGEHEHLPAPGQPGDGSSPHTRGAPEGPGPCESGARIIPAYAGSTPGISSSCSTCRDHPRIRGEHKSVTISANTFEGSSPHTRGAHAYYIECDDTLGIIPAYAGSTRTQHPVPEARRDHPRIRGEHLVMTFVNSGPLGSSPHTRGAHAERDQRREALRIIPAYAGSTFTPLLGVSLVSDHPRIRGEHSYCSRALS